MHSETEYPKILFFSSNHCAPCVNVEKLLIKINISMFGKKLHVDKINIEESGNRNLIEKYRITAVPTIVIADKKLSVNIQEEEIIDAILYAFISSVKI